MASQSFINIEDGADILGISTRTLYQRIKAGYYDVIKVGAVLADPKTGRPLTERKLRSIPVRSKGRQPGKYGQYNKRKLIYS